jgi:hypothetical protein
MHQSPLTIAGHQQTDLLYEVQEHLNVRQKGADFGKREQVPRCLEVVMWGGGSCGQADNSLTGYVMVLSDDIVPHCGTSKARRSGRM